MIFIYIVKTIRYTNGEECIELDNGGVIEFSARSRQAARGFDGISLMEYVGNGIYTISQIFSNISAIAMEELQSLMAGNTGKAIEVEYQLVRN